MTTQEQECNAQHRTGLNDAELDPLTGSSASIPEWIELERAIVETRDLLDKLSRDYGGSIKEALVVTQKYATLINERVEHGGLITLADSSLINPYISDEAFARYARRASPLTTAIEDDASAYDRIASQIGRYVVSRGFLIANMLNLSGAEGIEMLLDSVLERITVPPVQRRQLTIRAT